MKKLLTFLITISPFLSFGQYGNVDHWETLVYAYDTWRYFEGDQQPPSGWQQTNFNDASWKQGPGGFGFEDDDDSTLIPYDTSVYMRAEFFVFDTSDIRELIISADFDDGFVAYLNGYEVARANIGTPFVEPPYNQQANGPTEARLYQGLQPLEYIIRAEVLRYALRPGKNVFAVQVHNHYFGGLDMSSNFYLHAGIISTAQNYGNPPDWFITPPLYTTTSHLPVFKFEATGLNSDFKKPGKMEVSYDKNGGRNAFRGPGDHYSGDVTIKWRGNSTLAFPKKSYRFETVDSLGNNRDVELLDFPIENDWVLYAPYSDKSLLRNYLTYKLGESIMPYAPRTRFAEVMMNDYYIGAYVFTEKLKIDNNRVDISRLNYQDTTQLEITGGYMLKVDWDSDTATNAFITDHDTIFPGFKNITYQYYDPEKQELHPKQQRYIQNFVTEFENTLLSDNFTDPIEGYHNYIDKQSFADFWLLNELSKDVDAFRFSVYMYKANVNEGGKLHLGPIWDFNLGYGNVNYGTEGATYTYGWIYDGGSNRVFWPIKLFEDPSFADYTNCRWFNLRQNRLHEDTLMAIIDQGIMELDSAAERNHYLWKTIGRYVWPNYFVGATYEEEIDYLKSWVSTRLHWMDVNMPGDCKEVISVREIAGEQLQDLAIEVYPNPMARHLFIDLPITTSGEEVQSITMLDSRGAIVVQETSGFTGNQLRLDLPDLARGIYSLSIRFADGSTHEAKLVKQE